MFTPFSFTEVRLERRVGWVGLGGGGGGSSRLSFWKTLLYHVPNCWSSTLRKEEGRKISGSYWNQRFFVFLSREKQSPQVYFQNLFPSHLWCEWTPIGGAKLSTLKCCSWVMLSWITLKYEHQWTLTKSKLTKKSLCSKAEDLTLTP